VELSHDLTGHFVGAVEVKRVVNKRRSSPVLNSVKN
jgi:hypothetical protein